MRLFLIKFYFGEYWYKLPGQKRYNQTIRAGFWNFNAFLVIALLGFAQESLWLLAIPYTLFALYYSFPLGGKGYFQTHPVQWDELSDGQKWYYGSGIGSSELKDAPPLTARQFGEYLKLRDRFKKKYNLK